MLDLVSFVITIALIVKGNVMNTVSVPVSVCLLELNILVPAYFGYCFEIYHFINI